MIQKIVVFRSVRVVFTDPEQRALSKKRFVYDFFYWISRVVLI